MKCLKAKIITAFYEVMMDLHRRPEIELTRVIREDVLNGDFPSEFEGMSCTPLAKEMAMGLHAKWIRTPWERKKDMDIECLVTQDGSHIYMTSFGKPRSKS